MNKSPLLISAMMFCALPATSPAVELIGKKLELYGKVHLSLDFSDPDASGEDSQTSVSNNSSRIGFKGQHAINENTTLKWQYEQGVDVEEGGGEFATRNSFLGLKGNLGEVRVGHHDTPSKTVGSRWGMFSDTVGDRRAILGAYSGYGNKLNDRADNAILYINQFNALELQAMYSASNPDSEVSGSVDDNDTDLTSVSLTYQADMLTLAAAIENWSLDPENSAEEVDNLRLTARYKMDQLTLGAIYETTDSDDEVYNRDAFGVNAAYAISNATDVRLQYLAADDHDGLSASGASQLALGVFNNLDKATQIYAVYTTTDNDSNAQYQGIDGGHGDELETELGGSPSSLSLGVVYKF
ncbi:MAG: porin [Thioalkalispiraceae bacterium]